MTSRQISGKNNIDEHNIESNESSIDLDSTQTI